MGTLSSAYVVFFHLYQEKKYDDAIEYAKNHKENFSGEERLQVAYGVHNISVVLQSEIGDLDGAIRASEIACLLAPGDIRIITQLCYMYCSAGRFEEAWSRRTWDDFYNNTAKINWKGQHTARLLINNRNGFGDLIQFLRFMPIARKNVHEMVLQIPNGSAALLRTSPLLKGVDLLEAGKQVFCSHIIEMMTMPAALELNRHAVANIEGPMFSLPEPRVEKWRALIREMSGDRPAVGLVWGGGEGRARNLPLSALLPMTDNKDLHFFGLTNMQDKAALFAATTPDNFSDLGLFNWLDMACVMRALDTVVAPDVGFAHLAAAVGTKTFVALPTPAEWRWGVGSETTPWYPTMRLFRQKTAGNWTDVIEAMKAALP